MYFYRMNKSIVKLAKISQKEERLIIGLMSGTSLDGLDVALCRIAGSGTSTELSLLHFTTMPYEDEFREWIRQVFAKRAIDHQVLCGLNAYVAEVHSRLILDALAEWGIDPVEVDAIASHGQTVFHAPQSHTGDKRLPNSTLQIGDGDHFAVRSGIITLSDFRQKHLAAGGEGAPLAAYGDFLLFSSPAEHRILLNIGGISNFTFLPQVGTGLEAYATDLGPGNTMMNQYMFRHFGKEMDFNAEVALSGQADSEVLERLKNHNFLTLPFPKTTGPELFNLDYLNLCLQDLQEAKDLTHADMMATLNKFAAETMVEGIERAIEGLENVKIYVSGGGLHNPMLMQQLETAFPNAVSSFLQLGLDPDAKEACLFAVLANETLAGDSDNVTAIKDSPAVCMGKISLPY